MTEEILRADLTCDGGRAYDSARCELPTGEVVEVRNRRTPFYDLARELAPKGFGNWKLQAFTPTGTPSLRGHVGVMAGLTVEEGDRSGLRLKRYRPFPAGGRLKDGNLGCEGSPGTGKRGDARQRLDRPRGIDMEQDNRVSYARSLLTAAKAKPECPWR